MPGEFSSDQLREMLATREAEAEQAMRPSQINVRTATADLPAAPPSSDPYSVTSWGQSEFDFVTPSGQRCLMRRVPEIELLQAGILDKVTRLPGLSQALVDKSEGKPPTPEMDIKSLAENEGALMELFDVVNKITIVAVVKPKLYPVPVPDAETGEEPERIKGRVYVDNVDLEDRMAIMNKALAGLTAMDSFRPES